MENISPTADLHKGVNYKGRSYHKPFHLGSNSYSYSKYDSLFQFTTYSLLLVRISMAPPLLMPVNISFVVNSQERSLQYLGFQALKALNKLLELFS